MGHPLTFHSDEITDCRELPQPMCIATCSLDHTIVFYDLVNYIHLKTIPKAHITGLRSLTFVEAGGGFLISCAYEASVKVWQPGNIYGDQYLGTMKSANKAIITSCIELHG